MVKYLDILFQNHIIKNNPGNVSVCFGLWRFPLQTCNFCRQKSRISFMSRQILKGGKPMRNMKKWLVLLMTVAMLVNVLGVSAMATENSAPLALSVSRAAEGGMVQVDILATEAQTVADGKLVLTYDADKLIFKI